MRFVSADSQAITLPMLEAALQAADTAYTLEADRDAERDSADLLYRSQIHAELEINRPGDGLFEEEIAELAEPLEGRDQAAAERVASTLARAKAIVAVRVLFGARDPDETLRRLDPLWQWLFAHRTGLLQADGEGYHGPAGLVCETAE